MIGTTLADRYRIDSELGQGGMGVVYRAHDTRLGRDVAIKMLSHARLGTEGRARLLREAQATAQLNHPNIVSVYDAGEADASPFIVMELVEGQTLHDRRPQAVEEIVEIARQVCAALEHAHAHGLVHRDLKPENVVLTPAGAPKLMDFGLARSGASRLTEEGALVGTVHYMAPEQALGQEVDGRADLYALGAMLYELAAGRPPFEGGDPIAIISQHLNAPVVPPRAYNEGLPAGLDELIVRLMNKRPDDRPTSAAEVSQALRQLVAAEPERPLTAEIPVLDRIVRGRIVGRQAELAEAVAHWQRAVAGEGRTLLISGEPGIGKTRLTQELATRVEVLGGWVLTGECYAESGAPYGPLAQIIRAAFAHLPALDLPGLVVADLAALAPDLRHRLPEAPVNPPLESEADQRRLFESVAAFCLALTDRAPLLLVMDDVHWADSGTLLLLRHLARRLRQRPAMIVATYREVELDGGRPFHQVLVDLNRERLAVRLKLARLDREQTRALLAAMFAGDISPDLVENIYRETEGNPFFIEEVCKTLIEDGKISYRAGRWQQPALAEIDVPHSVRLAIQARVGRLPEPAQEILQLASVIGREFDYGALARASGMDEEALITALEGAERAQLIREVAGAPDVVFTFAHALIPAALVESVSTLRRRALHRRVAKAIEDLRPDASEVLAHHYAVAGDRHRAADYYRRAAGRAKAIFAYEVAIQHLVSALDLLDSEAAPATRPAMLEELADLHRLVGKSPEAIPLYEEALAAWRGVPDGDKMTAVRLHRKIGETATLMVWFEDRQRFEETGRVSFQAALRLAEGEPPHPETVRLMADLSQQAWLNRLPPRWDEAESYAQRATEIAEQLSEPAELSTALGALAKVYGGKGLFRERVQVSLRRLELSRDPQFSDAYERANIFHETGKAMLHAGDYTGAISYFEEEESLGRQLEALDHQVLAWRYLAQCWFRLDRWEAVLETEEKRRALERRYPNFLERAGLVCFHLALSASVHALRGDAAQAVALRDESKSIMIGHDGPPERWERTNHY